MSAVFQAMSDYEYGELHLARDAETGLRAIIALHDLTLGPALGGCRFIEYASEDAAILDALRLARGMTYKAAISGIPHGGGKSVIIKPAGEFDRDALFRSFGRFIENLNGRYITAEDSGTSPADMDSIRVETKHVTGVANEHGGLGDPSPLTARGVRRGMEALVKAAFERTSFDGLRVAVQGVGHVGYYLCQELHERGAKLTVADVDAGKTARAVEAFGAEVVQGDAIFDVSADVFAPCALGAILDEGTIGRLDAKVICGAANNQLATPEIGDALHAKGVLYGPDYLVNAGGLMNVAAEYAGADEAWVVAQVDEIHDTMVEIVERAKRTGEPTHRVADAVAEDRLRAARG